MALSWTLTVATLAHLVLGVVLLFVVWPPLAFRLDDIGGGDRRVAQLGLMLTWLIVGGYMATPLHVWGVAFIIAWAFLARVLFFRLDRARNPYRLSPVSNALASLLDHLALVGELPGRARAGLRRLGEGVAGVGRLLLRDWSRYLSILVVVAVAVYIRFAWNVTHAALLYSDAYETVAWMKGLPFGLLFPNGIYPQGYYMVMSAVQLFSHASPFPLEKFFGPFIGVCMVLSVMWAVYRLTDGNLAAVLAAGVLYGALPALLPYEAARQAASDAQEFGNALVLPVMWLVFRSWTTGSRGYRVGAVGLITAIALCHPIALINAVVAAVAATLGAWSVGGFERGALREYVRMVLFGAGVSIAPLAIAFAVRVPILATALPFATGTAQLSAPPVGPVTWSALAGVMLLLVVRIGWRRHDWELGIPITLLLFLALSVGIQQLPRVGIVNLALAVRSGELVALAQAVGVGAGLFALDLLRERYLHRGVWARSWPVALVGVLSLVFWLRYPPTPVSAYTLDSNAFVAAFERVATTQPRYQWLSVAHNGYPFALGQGFNEDPTAWVANATLGTRWPRYRTASGTVAIGETYVFLFVQRYRLDPGVPFARQLDTQYALARSDLLRWIADWEARYGPMPVYERRPNLTVYYLARPGAPPPQ